MQTKWKRAMGSGRWGRCVGWFLIGVFLTAGLSSAEETEKSWTADLALSIAAQSGTTDTFAGSLDAKVEREWEKDRLSARFTGVYGTTRKRGDGRTSNETIQNAQSLFFRWKRQLDKRMFWDSGTEASRDTTQDLELRAALASGPGYRFWSGEDGAKRHFDMSAGMGYRYEVYDGNSNGFAESTEISHFADAVVTFEYRNMFFDDRIEYTHTGSARMPVNETSSYILKTEAIISVPLSDAWSFRTSVLAEYVANPGADEVNNTTTRTAVGLGYKF
jgi:hypothetical protein